MAKKKILTDNGQEILPITHESCVLDNNGVSIGSKIGNINELATDSRTDLVSAINDILEFKDNMKQEAEELKQEMTNIKQELVDTLVSKGVDCSNDKTINEILGILAGTEFVKGNVKQVACSQTHLLILKNDGTVWGCGYNGYGQLGDNTTTSTKVFVKSNIDNVSSIVCGGYNYSIALKNDGTIWGCGYNSGQLGGSGAKYTFTQLDITDVKQVACGYAHTIVLKNDGTLWGTGNADAGQLGIGYQNSGKTTFTQITTNVGNIKEVICGGYCTFIIKNDDTLWVTGQNYGNLGTGDTAQKNNFTQVTTNVNDIKQVAAGSKHTMLLKNDGTLWAVGYDGYGQLGLNNGSTITTFKQVTSNVKQVVCGDNSTIILKNDGSVMGCGYNTKGELGLNHINTQKTFASPQIPNINVKEVFCSNCGQITVLLTDNGEIFTCGINSVGQLGLGVTSDYITIFNKVTFNI